MAVRVIEIVVPAGQGAAVRKVLSEYRPIESWSVAENEEGGRRTVIKALVDPDYQQSTLDALQDALSGTEGWRIVLQPTDAVIPKPEPDEAEREAREAQRRASTREVLHGQIERGARLTGDYLLFVALSTVVAGSTSHSLLLAEPRLDLLDPRQYLPRLLAIESTALGRATTGTAVQLHPLDLRCIPTGEVDIVDRSLAGIGLRAVMDCSVRPPVSADVPTDANGDL